jgi:hypothetical protein
MNMDLLNELDPALMRRVAEAYKTGALVKVAGDGRMYAMREETDGVRGWWVWSLMEHGSQEHMVRGDTCTCKGAETGRLCVHLRLVKYGY